jgi:hypothetical protein
MVAFPIPSASLSPDPFRVLYVSHRPLALVSAVTIGDYLLWNWSLSHGHDVLALVSGLTLPPLTIAWLWLLALSLARLLARSTRRSPAPSPAPSAAARQSRRREAGGASAAAGTQESAPASSPAPIPAAASSSRKLAA